MLYATTQEFLTHFGLGSRRDLPGIDDLKAAGLLDPLDESDVPASTGKRRRGGLEGRLKGVSPWAVSAFGIWLISSLIILLLLFGGNRFST